jgi:hypothetical protein
VTARVILQGRDHHNGVYATLDKGESGFAETAADGSFTINNIVLGWHILRLDMPGYLAVEGQFLATQNQTVLGDLRMLGGDAYGDNLIDILDLALVAVNYDSSPPRDARADINDNGIVDIFDLTMVTVNYDKQGPTGGQNAAMTVIPPTLSSVLKDRPVAVLKAPDASSPRATWTLDPAQPTYAVGSVVTATLSLTNATPVFGADVRQAYDDKQLRPRDAAPASPQANGRVGSLFSDGGFIPVNRAEGGTFRVAMTRADGKATPAMGTLAQVVFEVVGCGETVFDPNKALRLTDGKAAVVPFNAAPPVTLRTACP